MERVRHFKEEELVNHYDEHVSYKTPVTLELLRKIFNSCQFDARLAHVLDLGCGNGVVSNMFKTEWDCRVVGVDYSSKRIDVANKLHKDIHFVFDDIYNYINNCELTFNVISLFEVLEHLEEPKKVLSKAVDLMNPNHSVIIGSIPIGSRYKAHLQYYESISHAVDTLNITPLFYLESSKHLFFRYVINNRNWNR